MARRGMLGGTMATSAATTPAFPTAFYGNPTAYHGNPHSTGMSTAPRIRVPWYAVEVRGRFRGFAAGSAAEIPRYVANLTITYIPQSCPYGACSKYW